MTIEFYTMPNHDVAEFDTQEDDRYLTSIIPGRNLRTSIPSGDGELPRILLSLKEFDNRFLPLARFAVIWETIEGSTEFTQGLDIGVAVPYNRSWLLLFTISHGELTHLQQRFGLDATCVILKYMIIAALEAHDRILHST